MCAYVSVVTWWLGKANKQVDGAAGRQGKGTGRKDDEMMRGWEVVGMGKRVKSVGGGSCLFAEKLHALYPRKP